MSKYAYCDICKKEISDPTRKPMVTFRKVLWVLVIIASLGIAAIAFIIVYANKPKHYCSTCFSKLRYTKEPIKTKEQEEKEITANLSSKEKVMRKTEKAKANRKPGTKKVLKLDDDDEEEDVEGDTFCEFCGEAISSSDKRCPYCHIKLD
ncbi:MAG: hypothetical protein KGD73_02580 [Candidatus Lokiarchaeota archaeon]|nr:hypothetical protein [Candidatus Lokiarchaeota archaeon]